MKWHRAFSIGTFWISVVALLVALGLYWSVFLSPASEDPGSKKSREIVLAAGVPFLVALTVALISLLSRGLDRVDSSDTEYSQFCIDELDRFKASMLIAIERIDSACCSEFLKSAHFHLASASTCFSRVVNRDRRKHITSYAKSLGYHLSSDLLGMTSGDPVSEKRVALFFRWSDSEGDLVKDVRAGLEKTFFSVDTSWTPETTKPAQGGLSC